MQRLQRPPEREDMPLLNQLSLTAVPLHHLRGLPSLAWILKQLFFTSDVSIQPHFDRLNELGVEQMTYANHEAVPLREDVRDYFREASTFKVNHLLLPLSHEVGERTWFWRRRTTHRQYMLAYDNGKSAVKVLPGRIVPESVHRWRTLKPGERRGRLDPPSQESGVDVAGTTDLPVLGEEGAEAGSTDECFATNAVGSADDEQLGGGLEKREDSGGGWQSGLSQDGSDQLVNRIAMADPRELRFDEVLECSDPCVLHYPSCGLEWLRDKYRLLGSFPCSWFDGKLPIAPCFHLDARDAMHEAKGAASSPEDEDGARKRPEGAEDRVRLLYRKEVMLCPDEHPEEMQAQLGHGVLCVIGGPARVIEQALDARGSPRSKVTPFTLLATKDRAHRSNGAKKERPSAREGTSGTEVEGAEGDPKVSPSVAAALRAAAEGQPPMAPSGGNDNSLEGVGASSGLDNAWILAACAREFL